MERERHKHKSIECFININIYENTCYAAMLISFVKIIVKKVSFIPLKNWDKLIYVYINKRLP